jgi:hypothetical protein
MVLEEGEPMWIGYLLGGVIIGFIGVAIAMFLGWPIPALFAVFYSGGALGWIALCSFHRRRKTFAEAEW